MASVTKDAKGWRILFVDKNGDRRTIRPGKGTNKATAHKVGRYIDSLVATVASNGTMDRQTALWVADVSDAFHAKLVRAGLVEPREPVEQKPDRMTLSAFLADHIEHGRTSQGKPAAQSTLAKWIGTERFLNQVFPDRELGTITAEDAHQFRKWLDKRRIKQATSGRRGQPMAENAKRKHIANCKMFFNAAKRRGLIQGNPFEAQVSGTEANRSRDHFVTLEDTAKLLEAAPDAQWRLLISLWRLAGLRKMEVFSLTWGDVLWTDGKLRVRSQKTAHKDGCEMRYVPIRDVQQYLEDAHHAARPAGKQSLPADQRVITRFSRSNSNLDKPLRKIIEAAGLMPWPKLFQNMRASCETQWLKQGERADLVANWIGHSVTIQNRHYVQHTDDDIDAFNAKPSFGGGTVDTRNDAKRPKVAHEDTRLNTKKNAGERVFSYSSQRRPVAVEGLEPPTRGL